MKAETKFRIKITLLPLIILLIGVIGFFYYIFQFQPVKYFSQSLSFAGITLIGIFSTSIVVTLYDFNTFGWQDKFAETVKGEQE